MIFLLAQLYEENPETLPSLGVAVIGWGAVVALISIFIWFPVIDYFLRGRYRLGRGQALSLLLLLTLTTGGIACGVAYYQLHDHPRFQSEEKEIPYPETEPIDLP